MSGSSDLVMQLDDDVVAALVGAGTDVSDQACKVLQNNATANY